MYIACMAETGKDTLYMHCMFANFSYMCTCVYMRLLLWSVCSVLAFRMASSDQTRLFESYQTLVARITAMCLGKFQREMERERRVVEAERRTRTEKDHFYDVFRRKVDKLNTMYTALYTHIIHHAGLV